MTHFIEKKGKQLFPLNFNKITTFISHNKEPDTLLTTKAYVDFMIGRLLFNFMTLCLLSNATSVNLHLLIEVSSIIYIYMM